MWVNFIIVWIGEHIFHWQPQTFAFTTNQLIVAYVRTIITLFVHFIILDI